MEIVVLSKKEKNEISEKYKNVRFIKSKDNIFITLEENKEAITGEFVTLLNDVDSSTVDYYRCMVNSAMEENADVVMSNVILNYNDGGKAFLNLMESILKT